MAPTMQDFDRIVQVAPDSASGREMRPCAGPAAGMPDAVSQGKQPE